ncbi:hypothetical protein MMC10_008868 [Thelotrema lepadinum]|nr:hypothetical protein [Thelotrema lepadinum]
MSLTNGDHGGDTPGGGDKSVMNLTSTGRDRSWGHTDDFGTFIHADHLNITNYTDPLTPEFIFGMTMINLTNVDSLKTWPDSANVVATECMLKWCVLQTGTDDTNTTVTNGTLQQSLVPRDDVSISKGSMEDGGINGGDWWISFNSPGRTSPYNVSSFASLYISDFLIQDLLGLLSPNGISDPNSTTDSSGGQDVKFYTSVVGIDDGNQINALPNPAVQAIYTNGNFTQTFEILARAMTSELFRSDNTTVVTGSQDISTTKLVVLWVWITLPLGVIILSALFLILTVVASARVNAPIWKSGLLPVLLHGFDSADARRHAQGQLEKESEMRDYADGIDIRLRHTDEDGIRIAREEPDNTITTRRDRRGYVEVADDRQENGESSVTELRQLPNKPGLEYPSASSGFPGE